MTKRILSCIIALIIVILPLVSCETPDDGKYTVGICQLVQHPALDAATQGFIDALKEELGADNVEILNENASNDTSTCTTIINNFVSKKVDLIMANATPALQAAVNTTTTIPILGTSITEYGVALGIDNFSGVVGANVSGTSDLADLDAQAQMILDLFPGKQKVALLYCKGEPNSDYQIKQVRAYLEARNITCIDAGFTDSNDVSVVAARAAAEAEVIYIPTDNTAAACKEIINGVIDNTPVIAGEEGICSGCGVATLAISYYELGKTTGKMAAKILKGEANIEQMPIEYAPAPTKKYNPVKCAQLGIDTAALEAAGYVAITTEG